MSSVLNQLLTCQEDREKYGKRAHIMSLLAIKYDRGYLAILNQLLLPETSVYEDIKSVEDGWLAIRAMKVRLYVWLYHQLGVLNCTC